MASPAQFGLDLSKDWHGVTGQLVIAQPYKACSSLTNARRLRGTIALIERGDCMFVEKVRRAQNAGAIGVIVIDNKHDTEYNKSPVFAMSGDGSLDVTIPAVFVYGRDGAKIKHEFMKRSRSYVRIGERTMNARSIFERFLRRTNTFRRRRYNLSGTIRHDVSNVMQCESKDIVTKDTLPKVIQSSNGESQSKDVTPLVDRHSEDQKSTIDFETQFSIGDHDSRGTVSKVHNMEDIDDQLKELRLMAIEKAKAKTGNEQLHELTDTEWQIAVKAFKMIERMERKEANENKQTIVPIGP